MAGSDHHFRTQANVLALQCNVQQLASPGRPRRQGRPNGRRKWEAPSHESIVGTEGRQACISCVWLPLSGAFFGEHGDVWGDHAVAR
jgi:hypothetical protein